MIDFDKLFADFSNIIKVCDHFLTEDGMRYYFFLCLLFQDPNLNHYILELPYQKMAAMHITADINLLDTGKHKQQELDMLYDGDLLCCFEFKFHRTGDLTSTYAQPDAAGSLINDLNRLQLIKKCDHKGIKKFLIYLTDSKMHEYMANPQKGFSEQPFRKDLQSFYLLRTKRHFSAMTIRLGNKNSTFRESTFKSFIDKNKDKDTVKVPKIRMRYSTDIEVDKRCSSFANAKGYIRIYEVK